MEAAAIRENLHEYINNADEKQLKLMLAFVKEHSEDEEDLDYEFTEDDINIFNERREKYLRGEGKTYTWEEIEQKAKSRK